MWKEIISVFKKDNLYQQAFDEACEMLETDGKMYVASVESLRQSDMVYRRARLYEFHQNSRKSLIFIDFHWFSLILV